MPQPWEYVPEEPEGRPGPDLGLWSRISDLLMASTYGSAGAASELIKPGATPQSIAAGAWQGLGREKRLTYEDVLTQAGVPEMGKIGPISGRGVLGFGLDIVLDPLFGPLNIGGKAIVKGLGLAGKLVPEAIAKGLYGAEPVRSLEKAFTRPAKIAGRRMGKEAERASWEFTQGMLQAPYVGPQKVAKLIQGVGDKDAWNKLLADPADAENLMAGFRAPVSDFERSVKGAYDTLIEEYTPGLKPADLDQLVQSMEYYYPRIAIQIKQYNERAARSRFELPRSRLGPRKMLEEGGPLYMDPMAALALRVTAGEQVKHWVKLRNDLQKINALDGRPVAIDLPMSKVNKEMIIKIPKEFDDYVTKGPYVKYSGPGGMVYTKPVYGFRFKGKALEEAEVIEQFGEEALKEAMEGTTSGVLKGELEFFIKRKPLFYHPEMGRVMENLSQAIDSDKVTAGLVRLYDTSLGLWKISVLAFPAYFVRNDMTDKWLTYLDLGMKALNPLYWTRTFKTVTRKFASTDMYGEWGADYIREGLEEGATISGVFRNEATPIFRRLGREAEPTEEELGRFFQEILEKPARGKPAAVSAIYGAVAGGMIAGPPGAVVGGAAAAAFGALGRRSLVKRSFDVGNFSENWNRFTHTALILEGIPKPKDPEAARRIMQDVAARVAKFHFIYAPGGLTAFEEKVMRRIIPFYRWSRGSIPLMVESILERPGRLVSTAKAFQILEADELPEGERQLLPNWLLERFSIVVDHNEKNQPQILYGIDLPVDDLNTLFAGSPKRTLERLLSMSSPIMSDLPIVLSILATRATGQEQPILDYDFFTGERLGSSSYQNYYRQAYPVLAQWPGVRDWLGLEKITYENEKGELKEFYRADPMNMFVFLSILGRFYSTFGKLGDARRGTIDKAVNFFSGAKYISYDITRPQLLFNEEINEGLGKSGLELHKEAVGFLKGHRSGRQYSDARQKFFADRRRYFDDAEAKAMAKIDRPEYMEAIRRSLLSDEERALEEYYDIQPEEDENGFISEKTMQDFFAQREEFLAEHSQGTRDFIEKAATRYLGDLSPEARQVEEMRRDASAQLRQYLAMPKYLGMPSNVQEEVDEALVLVRTMGAGVGWQQVLKTYGPTTFAWAKASNRLRNPLRKLYWRGHPLLARFFTDLAMEQEAFEEMIA